MLSIFTGFYFILLLLMLYKTIHSFFFHIQNYQTCIELHYCKNHFLYLLSTALLFIFSVVLLDKLNSILYRNIEFFDILILLLQFVVIFIFFKTLSFFVKKQIYIVIISLFCRIVLLYMVYDSIDSPTLNNTDVGVNVSIESKQVGIESTIVAASPVEETALACRVMDENSRTLASRIIDGDARGIVSLFNHLVQYDAYMTQVHVEKTHLLNGIKGNSLDQRQALASEERFERLFDTQRKLCHKHFADRYLELDKFYRDLVLLRTGIDPTVISSILVNHAVEDQMGDPHYKCLDGGRKVFKPVGGIKVRNYDGLLNALSSSLNGVECNSSGSIDYDSEETITECESEIVVSETRATNVKVPSLPQIAFPRGTYITLVAENGELHMKLKPFLFGENYLLEYPGFNPLLNLYSNNNVLFGESLKESKLASVEFYSKSNISHGLVADYSQLRQAMTQDILPKMETRLDGLLQELVNVPGGTSRVGPLRLPSE